MSFICFYQNEVVQNQKRVLVPIEIRKVHYINEYITINSKSADGDNLLEHSTKKSSGWETIKEASIAHCNYDKWVIELSKFYPKITQEKIVTFKHINDIRGQSSQTIDIKILR